MKQEETIPTVVAVPRSGRRNPVASGDRQPSSRRDGFIAPFLALTVFSGDAVLQ
jgi:hypothetical protein